MIWDDRVKDVYRKLNLETIQRRDSNKKVLKYTKYIILQSATTLKTTKLQKSCNPI